MRRIHARTLVVSFAVLLVAFIAGGCSRSVPQEVTDVNRALQDAKDACATVYATDTLGSVQGGVDSMNSLADDRKYRKARKEAEPLRGEVAKLDAASKEARAAAKASADAAVKDAKAAVKKARDDGAAEHAQATLAKAEKQLADAERAAKDPCRYREASTLAAEAAATAKKAAEEAVAEKRRLEEARRKAEEEARRKAEEERRRAEEERLRNFPPSWTVSRGESLWKISGNARVYGDPTFWPLLFDANRGKISDPDLIYPGQELTIPRNMSDQEMLVKLREMWRALAAAAEE